MLFQLGSALLDACVLASLQDEQLYGYALTQRVKDTLGISESTLYPVLRRLQKEAYLNTFDKPYQGRTRRYYSITNLGSAKLSDYKTQWISYKHTIDKMLGGVNHD